MSFPLGLVIREGFYCLYLMQLNDYIGSTNTAPWFLMDSSYNEQCDGAVWLDRVDCEITSRLGANDENIWDGYARLSAGFVDWRFILGGGLSGGSSL